MKLKRGKKMNRKNVIGIVAAMESEISLIKEEENIDEIIFSAGLEFCVGKLKGKDVVVVQCGMGKVNAAIATQILIERFQAESIINVGCAGCLNDTLEIGDFVVSKEVVQHDYDVSAIGFQKGEIPYTGKISFEADETLIDYAKQAIEKVTTNRHVVVGNICTGDQFISSDEQKEIILQNYHGDCAEMEGAAVGQTAYLNHVPFVIIRAMSDKANQKAGSNDFSEYVEQVTKEGAEVVVTMVESIVFE